MLRNRSTTVTTKQAVMGDKNSISSSISSILGSPRFFHRFSSRKVYDAETAAISPTSILDTKNSFNFVNPFGYGKSSSKSSPSSSSPAAEIANKSLCSKPETEVIGLALVHLINDEKTDEKSSRMVLFGAKLKVQIPTENPSTGTPNSPANFGIKTRNSQSFYPSPGSPAKDYFNRQLSLKEMELSLKEMELSEDYTCVITHGPNPKTTHIFDDCIVVNCCEERLELSDDQKKMEADFRNSVSDSPSGSFLSYCHTCKESLELGQDIYIYRGEKAFCSHECRFEEMLFEGTKNPEIEDDAF